MPMRVSRKMENMQVIRRNLKIIISLSSMVDLIIGLETDFEFL